MKIQSFVSTGVEFVYSNQFYSLCVLLPSNENNMTTIRVLKRIDGFV